MRKLIVIEFKKMWGQITKLSIIAFALLVIIDSGLGIFGERALNDKGEEFRGIFALQELKSGSKELKGEINQKYLDNLVKKYNSSEIKKIHSDNRTDKSKYSHSNYFINFVNSGPDFNIFDLTIDFNFVKSEKEFYKKYKDSASESIKVHNEYNGVIKYTSDQMDMINKKIENIETPIKINYSQGLKNIIYEYIGSYTWMIFAILFALSILFSKDSNNGIDELSLCSKFGRRKHMNAKILAGNLFILTVHTILLGILFIVNIFASPLKGWGQSIQTLWYNCYYNISLGTGILISISLGFLGLMVIGNFFMMLSIKIKNSKIAVALSILFIAGLIKLTATSNLLQLQLNPLYFGTNKITSYIPTFDTYYFIGEIIIPYSLIVVFLTVIYLTAIRILTKISYKKYKLN